MAETPVALILGGRGLLGQALMQAARAQGWNPVDVGRESGDMLDQDGMAEQIDRHAPRAIFNTVAWTQVDQAEDKPEAVMHINRGLPMMLARLLKGKSVSLLHYSTDFVFNGRKDAPYAEDDEPDPLNVYGRTKLEGDKALLQADLAQCCIIRAAWLFGPGRKNFISTILDLAAKNDVVSVVHDQIGSPTYTPDLAEASFELLRLQAKGLFHVVNSGRASWCELATAAISAANLHPRVAPIASADWPQKARRPAYSVLDTSRYTALTGKTMRPWLAALRDYVFREFLASGMHADGSALR
jgi:dTDP-4-dehydrorhamnose reductase